MVDVLLDTDHRLIKGKMLSQFRSKIHKKYMQERKSHGRDLFREGNIDAPPSQSDNLLKELREEMEKEVLDASKEDKSWISEVTFSLVRQKSIELRKGNLDEVKKLGRVLRQSLC